MLSWEHLLIENYLQECFWSKIVSEDTYNKGSSYQLLALPRSWCSPTRHLELGCERLTAEVEKGEKGQMMKERMQTPDYTAPRPAQTTQSFLELL